MSPDATLYAVDPYERGRLGFSIPRIVGMNEVGRVRNGRVVWVRKTGAEAGRTAEIRRVPFDFVFIDDAQSAERLRAEWETWSPLVAPDGIIALHDTQAIPGVAEQTSERFAREVVLADPRFEVLETIDSLTVLRRRGAAAPRP